MALEPGQVFAGFTIVRALGAGGMGVVYLARHPRLERLVALKVLHDGFAADPKARRAFNREATLISRLDHSNIVAVHDRNGPGDPTLWLSMRYVEGGDADRLLRAHPRGLDPARAVRLIADAAAALDHAHRHGVLHRDVKPGNLLVESDHRHGERALLTDFGIARALDDTRTLSGVIATFAYVAPERLSGSAADSRSDVYSLGATLYQLLTGETPYPYAEQAAVITAHLVQPPPAPSRTRPGLPAGLDAVIATALAKHPADRFQTCTDMVTAAADVLADNATGPTPLAQEGPARTQVVEPTWRARRRTGSRPPARTESRRGGTVVAAVLETLVRTVSRNGAAAPRTGRPAGSPAASEVREAASTEAPPDDPARERRRAVRQRAGSILQRSMSGSASAISHRVRVISVAIRATVAQRWRSTASATAVLLTTALIVVATQTSHSPGTSAARTSLAPTTTTPTQAGTTASTAAVTTTTSRWNPRTQTIVDEFPALLPPTPNSTGFDAITCKANAYITDATSTEIICGAYEIDPNKTAFRIRCNQPPVPVTSDPYSEVSAYTLTGSGSWTKPTGSGHLYQYDAFGWRHLHLLFDGAQANCTMTVAAGVAVVEDWWPTAPA